MKLGFSHYAPRSLIQVAWFEDGEEGAIVGQEGHAGMTPGEVLASIEPKLSKLLKDRRPRDYEEYEYLSVERRACEWVRDEGVEGTVHLTDGGWSFDVESHARAFLKALKTAIQTAKVEWDSDKPMPAWEREARAHGWLPPEPKTKAPVKKPVKKGTR